MKKENIAKLGVYQGISEHVKQGAPTQDLLTYKVNSLFNTETR